MIKTKNMNIAEIEKVMPTFKVDPQFPTIYKKCCKVLGVESMAERQLDLVTYPTNIKKHGGYSIEFPYREELNALFQLLVCRDAWWKVDNNWKPNWDGSSSKPKYVIIYGENRIDIDCVYVTSSPLAFRTSEIRDKFLDTFRDLIEKCKELI